MHFGLLQPQSWPFGLPVILLLKSLHPDVRFEWFEKFWPPFDFTLKSLWLYQKSFMLEKTTVSFIRSWSCELRLLISLDPTVRSDRFKAFYDCIDILFKSVRSDRWSLSPSSKLTVSPFSMPILDRVNFGCRYFLIWLSDLTDSKFFMLILTFFSNSYGRIADFYARP